MKKRMIKAMGVAITIIILSSLIFVQRQDNEQDPPGLGTLQMTLNR